MSPFHPQPEVAALAVAPAIQPRRIVPVLVSTGLSGLTRVALALAACVAVFALAALPRLPAVAVYVTADEGNWMERTDGRREEFGATFSTAVDAGDVIVIQTPGGGGFGAP